MKGFPKDAQPGDRVTFSDGKADQWPYRTGTVLDRAPQGWEPSPGVYADTYEASGFWLWIMPDEPGAEDTGDAVRVRYYSRGPRKGQAYRDDGPMCVVGAALGRAQPGGRKVTVPELLAEYRNAAASA